MFFKDKNVFNNVLDEVISLFLLETMAFDKVNPTLYWVCKSGNLYIDHNYVIKRNWMICG